MATFLIQLHFAENDRHRGEPAWSWTVDRAKALGIPGATVLRGISGYGRRGVLEEGGVFDFAPDLPVIVQFVCESDLAARLESLMAVEGLRVFRLRVPVELGWTGQ